MSNKGPSCTRDTMFKMVASFHCPPDLWNPKHTDLPVQAIAPTRTGLLVVALREILRGLGWEDGPILAGLLVDFTNHFPDDMRAAIASGIIDGLGLTVKKNEEDGTVEVDMPQLYNALAKQSGERRTPGGIILPGG